MIEFQTSVIEQAEDGVVSLLAPLLTALDFEVNPEIETLPETKDGLEEALVKPRITVAYRQSTFGEDKGNPYFAGLGTPAAQEETLHVDLYIRARGRKSDKGTYFVIEAARALLLGAVPFPGARGLWFTGQQLDDFETRGGWRYMLSVATSTVLVAGNTPAESFIERALAAWGIAPS